MEYLPWIASRAYSEAASSRTSPVLRLSVCHHRSLHGLGLERHTRPNQHRTQLRHLGSVRARPQAVP